MGLRDRARAAAEAPSEEHVAKAAEALRQRRAWIITSLATSPSVVKGFDSELGKLAQELVYVDQALKLLER